MCALSACLRIVLGENRIAPHKNGVPLSQGYYIFNQNCRWHGWKMTAMAECEVMWSNGISVQSMQLRVRSSVSINDVAANSCIVKGPISTSDSAGSWHIQISRHT